MKIQQLRAVAFAALFAAALSFTSCAKKDAQATEAMDADTTSTEASADYESPMDTVVKKNNDTIIDTGDARNPGQNTTGTQVP